MVKSNVKREWQTIDKIDTSLRLTHQRFTDIKALRAYLLEHPKVEGILEQRFWVYFFREMRTGVRTCLSSDCSMSKID